jgi:hypothetical protein
MKTIAAIVGLVFMATMGLAIAGVHPAFGGDEKITICHASGLAGTTKFETLTIGHEAVYGPGGHFNEDGTPQAGHEQDYFGACQTDTTTTDTTTTTETTTTTTTNPCPSNDCTPGTTCTNCDNPPPPCPNGEPPIHGQDGNPGNDSCNPCDAPVNIQKCPPPNDTVTTTTTQPPGTTTTGTTTESTTTSTTTTGEETTTPNAPKPPVVVHHKPHHHAKPHKKHNNNKMPPLCPVGVTAANSPQEPCAVQGSG